MASTEEKKEAFPAIGYSEENEDHLPTIIQSLCMKCHENGETRLLLVSIPFFREIIVSAFECPHCGYSANEIQQAAKIQDKGCTIQLNYKSAADLNRSIVKTEYATLRLEELDFEIPPKSQPGLFTTLEGIITRAIEGLRQHQPLRMIQTPEAYEKIEEIIVQLESILEGKEVTITLSDPSGNSFIQNPTAPAKDPNLHVSYFNRTPEQNEDLGLEQESNPQSGYNKDQPTLLKEGAEELEKRLQNSEFDNEIITLGANCSSCQASGVLKMHIIDIPHFKEVVIMAFTCEECGYKTIEVKAAGAISPNGRRYILRVETVEDLNRDILKSETCALAIPELDLELVPGSLGGRFTTVEGLISQIKEQIQTNSFVFGDSSLNPDKEKMTQFLQKFDDCIDLKIPFTVILDDPAGNSYLQNIYAPDPDPYLLVEDYHRNDEQNEELGINQMKTENYYVETENAPENVPPVEEKEKV